MPSMPQVDTSSENVDHGQYARGFAEAAEDLGGLVRRALGEGMSIHETEEAIFRQVLELGRRALGWFIEGSGDGNLGPVLELPSGEKVQRLPIVRSRPYMSVFGEFEITRFVYGTREGQKIEHVPLDSRLDLPAGKYSYLLEDWSQLFVVDQAFSKAQANLEKILGLRIPVDSLERICRNSAEPVVDYWDSLPTPPADEEGELLVQTADFKGVPMKKLQSHTMEPGADEVKSVREGKKMMALLGGVYSVDRFPRTPEEVTAALFRDSTEAQRADRPKPQHKRLRASLERDERGSTEPALAEIYSWMELETEARNPLGAKPLVSITDGQECLEDSLDRYRVDDAMSIETSILDILHVTPRLWDAAKLFHPPDAAGKIASFVRTRVLRVLRGAARAVVVGLRSMATKRRLSKKNRKALETICGYFLNNLHRMRYDEYLAAGYPIATGVIEGACRHLVKDRLERSGMRWTPPTAQAILDLRSVHCTGHWDDYHTFRRQEASERLYPFRGRCDTNQLRLVS